MLTISCNLMGFCVKKPTEQKKPLSKIAECFTIFFKKHSVQGHRKAHLQGYWRNTSDH